MPQSILCLLKVVMTLQSHHVGILMKMEVPLPTELSKCKYPDISKVETTYSCLPLVKFLWQMCTFFFCKMVKKFIFCFLE